MTPARAQTGRAGEIRSVLLTGGTGGLGGEAIRTLLATTDAQVTCLVRAENQSAADARLAARLGIPVSGRLRAFPGQLERPRFGLSPEAYDQLAAATDLVFHAAATVNLKAGYSELAAANVGSTLDVVAFAERHRALAGTFPRIAFISTVATLMAARSQGLPAVDESTQPTVGTAGPLGYTRGKVEAERILRAAARRGLPVTILRPGVLTGHSRTGLTAGPDLLGDLLSAVIALGAAPEVSTAAPIEMVDVAAAAAVTLATRVSDNDAPLRCYHLVRPEPLSAMDLFAALARGGHRFEYLPPSQWFALLESSAPRTATQTLAAVPEVVGFMLGLDPDRTMPRIRSESTWSTLTDSGFCAPAVDRRYLDLLVAAAQGRTHHLRQEMIHD